MGLPQSFSRGKREINHMEEMMVMTRDPQNLINQTIATTTQPTWKLYDNPFYRSQHHIQHHSLYRPPAHKIVACLGDLTFIRSIMHSELNIARAQINELKAELELERKVRKKVESLNKKLYRELSEEKKRRENVENVCEKLAKEIASDKLEKDRMKREIGEERKMLRMAEVLREERVQMKLADAKILFEEKLTELKLSKGIEVDASSLLKFKKAKDVEEDTVGILTNNDSITMSCCENSYTNNNELVVRSTTTVSKRRASPEPENPHIKRGIRGFVEFPRVVRAMNLRGRQSGSKAECQKAQLRLVLRQESPIRRDNLIMG